MLIFTVKWPKLSQEKQTAAISGISSRIWLPLFMTGGLSYQYPCFVLISGVSFLILTDTHSIFR